MERVVQLRKASLPSVRMREVDALRGQALARVVATVYGPDVLVERSSMSYPTAFGAASERIGIPWRVAGQVYVSSHLLSLASAAVRLGVISSTEAQPIVWQCAAEAARIGPRSLRRAGLCLGGCDFDWEIDTMNHALLHDRLFEL